MDKKLYFNLLTKDLVDNTKNLNEIGELMENKFIYGCTSLLNRVNCLIQELYKVQSAIIAENNTTKDYNG